MKYNAKKKKIVLLFVLLMGAFMMSLILYCVKLTNKKNYYTDSQLKEMSAMELYNVFVDNGLDVDEIQEYRSKEEVAELLKSNLEPFSEGVDTMSSVPPQFVEDVKNVYDSIIKKE